MIRLLASLVLSGVLAACGASSQLLAEREAELGACRGDAASARAELERVQGELTRCSSDRSGPGLGATAVSPATMEREGERELAGCKGELAPCKDERDACREALGRSRAETDAARGEVERLRGEEQALRRSLTEEIASRDVEIERLKASVSVRVVDRILFESGSAEILAEGRLVLDKVASVVAAGPDRVRVEGHTDDAPIGDALKRRYFSNWELSTARAASVVRYLQYGRGIDPARLEAVGLAQYRPDGPNDTREARQRNRRVVIVLTGASPAEAPR